MIIGIETAHANKTNRTGVEWYCFHVIQELKKAIPPAARVILYSNAPLRDGLEVLPSNWEVKILRWPLKKLWSQTRLAYELWRNPPDVFFAPGQLVPWHCPKNTIVTIHDSAFMADKKSYWWASRRYLRWMNRLIIKKSKKIILTADFNLRELKKYYGEAVGEKCDAISLAYDAQKYNLSAARSNAGAILEKYKITKPYLISIGRLEEKKNTARVVETFNLLKNSFSDLQLALAGGPGVGFKKIKRTIDASPFRADIVLTGFTPGDDLPKLLGNAEVFLFPSLYEGFGIPVLEAMACGCPVVAAQNTALPEIGGRAAVYVDPLNVPQIAAEVAKILKDSSWRARKISDGLEQASRFSWAKTAQATARVIMDCQNP